MKKITGIVLSFIIGLTSIFTLSAAETEPLTEVSWINHYNTSQDIIYNSDLVIYGEVVGQETEVRTNLVFTRSTIKVLFLYKGAVQKGDTVELLQTGGTCNGLTTPFIEGDPIDVGQKKVYALQITEEDPVYGQYYLLTGGNQGLYDFCPHSKNVSDLINEIESNMISPLYEVECYIPYIWGKKYVSFNISGLSGAYLTAAKEGMLSWNVGCNNVKYSYVSSSSADVEITYQSYGSTSWYGWTQVSDNGAQRINSVDILLNSYKMGSLDTYAFKAIVCHEGGHGLGIYNHYKPSEVVSIMYELAANYMNSYNTPRTADFALVNASYY